MIMLDEEVNCFFFYLLGKHNFNDFDIHVLSGTLKTFFRELEDPLIPLPMQDRFLKAISMC